MKDDKIIEKKKIALLIDYDNFSKEEYFQVLFDELNDIGDILIKYAFYSNTKDQTIKEKFIKLGIEPQTQFAISSGKNAVDIRMTIEAMHLLNKPYIDCICLATNDSDFTPLAIELKKNNIWVVGAGDKANKNYINCFNEFKDLSKLTKPSEIENKTTENSNDLKELVSIVTKLIDENCDDNGWADFSVIIGNLKKNDPSYDPKNYGATNKKNEHFFTTFLKDYLEFKQVGTARYIKVIVGSNKSKTIVNVVKSVETKTTIDNKAKSAKQKSNKVSVSKSNNTKLNNKNIIKK